jgi:hypothetical protein
MNFQNIVGNLLVFVMLKISKKRILSNLAKFVFSRVLLERLLVDLGISNLRKGITFKSLVLEIEGCGLSLLTNRPDDWPARALNGESLAGVL